jgi:hypothetical protein
MDTSDDAGLHRVVDALVWTTVRALGPGGGGGLEPEEREDAADFDGSDAAERAPSGCPDGSSQDRK